MQDLHVLVPPLLRLCQQAGQVICEHYHAAQAAEYRSKADDSPLTRADLDSHHLLQAGLATLAPAIPVLSEESPAQHKARRRDWRRYWLVDPLDGTKEFLARTGEFTINVALIDEHTPVLGVIYLPLQCTAYVGVPGVGARTYRAGRGGTWSVAQLATRNLAPGDTLAVLASRRHRGRRLTEFLDWAQRHWGPVERRNSGSALKFCQLAQGGGDIYPRFSPCCEWDTGAGHAVLQAAGGALVGLDGKPLRYNTHDSLISPHFYALAAPRHTLWRQLLGSAGR